MQQHEIENRESVVLFGTADARLDGTRNIANYMWEAGQLTLKGPKMIEYDEQNRIR